jgi:tetratricopeptide (TPR) repeat protein
MRRAYGCTICAQESGEMKADTTVEVRGSLVRSRRLKREPQRAVLNLICAASMIVGANLVWSQVKNPVTIHGRVVNLKGIPISSAIVHLDESGHSLSMQSVTDANGEFSFSKVEIGTVSLVAEYANKRSHILVITLRESGDQPVLNLVVEDAESKTPDSTLNGNSQAMEFSDNPRFVVAGVTDWTAAGGHGSDTVLRASEALNREAATLKASDLEEQDRKPNNAANTLKESILRAGLANDADSFSANRRLGEFLLQEGDYQEALSPLGKAFKIDPKNRENEVDLACALIGVGNLAQARDHIHRLLEGKASGDAFRVAGELEEKSGDPLEAVRQFERAVRIDPTEENYFEWGAELLIHRAVWQAKEVFERGIRSYPRSARLMTALGAALFAGALYDDAAMRLCSASDIDPENTKTYLFMGEIEMLAPNPPECMKERLARYLNKQPNDPLANYYFAMTIWKRSGASLDARNSERIEALLTKAITLDPKCSDAYLQLGNLDASRQAYAKAVGDYTKAIEANPQLSEAHYRLGVAYDRIGQRGRASQEFELHEQIEKQRAAVVDRERREVKQFVVLGEGTPAANR